MGNKLLAAASALFLFLFPFVSCGPSTDFPAACSTTQGSCLKEHTCLEYGGFNATDLAGVRESCESGAHTWSNSVCARAGTIGHCDFARDGTCETQWIDPDPLPLSERRLSCTSAGGIWHAP